MPLRELRHPEQVEKWLLSWGRLLRDRNQEGSLILIGSAAILLHAHRAGVREGFLDASMDVDPITFDEVVAMLCYESQIGSAFEIENGWHVNLMPDYVLQEFDPLWRQRSIEIQYEALRVIVPSVGDLMKPKLKRGEPRDLRHQEYARDRGLLKSGEQG